MKSIHELNYASGGGYSRPAFAALASSLCAAILTVWIAFLPEPPNEEQIPFVAGFASIIFSVTGLVLGIISRRDIVAADGFLQGKPLALAAIGLSIPTMILQMVVAWGMWVYMATASC